MKEKNELRTMTVGQLRAKLERFDDDSAVVFAHPSHDHWKTELAGRIRNLEEVQVKYSDYHRQFQICNENEEADDVDELQYVVVLMM